jgi:ElaB/YqjD/DUF883 family membrane-anchored ribosome-binding protein
MAAARSVQKELNDLRKEIAGIRADYARLKSRAGATKAEAVGRYSAIKDDLLDTVDAIKERVTNGTSDAVDDISAHIDELRDVVNEYTDKTEKTVAAHPLAAVAGAIAVGYLIARMNR